MEKEKKVRQKINWKKEMKLAPGYIVIILWVIFTFMLLGWILAASLSTTTDIFAGKALKFLQDYILKIIYRHGDLVVWQRSL